MWWKKQKEQNMSWIFTSTTMLPIPLAAHAKEEAIRNKNRLYKEYEDKLFNYCAVEISKAIKIGRLSISLPLAQKLTELDKDKYFNISAAAEVLVLVKKHLESYGYNVYISAGNQFMVSWENPKEVPFDELWKIAEGSI
jgi:hypothetical protein